MLLASLVIVMYIINSNRREAFADYYYDNNKVVDKNRVQIYSNSILSVVNEDTNDQVESSTDYSYVPPVMRQPTIRFILPKPRSNMFEEVKIDKLRSKTQKKKVKFNSDVNINGSLNSEQLFLKNKPFVSLNKKTNTFEFK